MRSFGLAMPQYFDPRPVRVTLMVENGNGTQWRTEEYFRRGYARKFSIGGGDGQQIHLRTEGSVNGGLGAVAA
jgi:hypothetical protein